MKPASRSEYRSTKKGADILLVTPSADFFAEPHIDGLIGYAKVFHQAGASWTVSSYASEAANFAMFIGSYEQMKLVAERIRKAAEDLGVKRIIFGECGHAWRVAYSFMNTLAGPFDFLDPAYPVPQHICEYTWDLIEKGELNLDKSANDHMTLTFHDSCNVARGSRMGDTPGGQFEIPRAIIKAVCNNFVDMAADTISEGYLLLWRRRRFTDRRPDGNQDQGCITPNDSIAGGCEGQRCHPHGSDLRDL